MVNPSSAGSSRLRGGLATACLLASWLASRPAAATESPVAEGVRSFEAAEEAEREGRYADALAAYDEALRRGPAASFAPRARARAADLRAHAEGAFEPWRRLTAARARSALLDEAFVRSFLEDALRFPDGRVRAEALLFAGTLARHRLELPALAEEALRASALDPHGDALTRSLATSELVALLRERGALGEALALAREAGVSPEVVAALTRETRRARLLVGSRYVMAAAAGVGLVSLGLLVRRGGAKEAERVAKSPALASAAWLGLGGAAIVRAWGPSGDPGPFLLLGFGLCVVVMAARAFGLVAHHRVAKVAGALLFAGAALGVAVSALAATEVKYLESFGW